MPESVLRTQAQPTPPSSTSWASEQEAEGKGCERAPSAFSALPLWALSTNRLGQGPTMLAPLIMALLGQ